MSILVSSKSLAALCALSGHIGHWQVWNHGYFCDADPMASAYRAMHPHGCKDRT